jgi:hypothetical protein
MPAIKTVTPEPGDLILVSSPGWGFALGRWAAGNPYDHIAVVVRNGLSTNIDKPASRKLPAAKLLKPHLSPIVLRPRWQTEEQRERFVDWMESLDGLAYDVERTLKLIPRILLRRFFRLALPFKQLEGARDKWICTDAVFLGLERSAHFRDVIQNNKKLDWVALRCATTNDFLRMAEKHPELMERVSLP